MSLLVSHLSKVFVTEDGPVEAVKDLSFEVKKGELVGFMGPNGAGKSTTMRILAGYMQPTAGDALIAGVSVSKNPLGAQKRLGYLAEQPGPYEDITGAEYLAFLAEAHGVPHVGQAVDVVSRLTRCQHYLARPMGELSKGMRQRVFFAGALVNDPEVLILDEPTDGLDPNQKHEMRLVLKELAKNKAVLVSTHILEEAEAICDRVLVINQGKIVLNTTPDELKRQGKGNIQLAFRVLTQNKSQNKGE